MHTGTENPQSFTACTIGGHVGISKTVERISSRFYWPDITGAVKQFCRTCRTCQLSKEIAIQKTSATMHPDSYPNKSDVPNRGRPNAYVKSG